jgi:hypothetical protein
VEGGLDLASGSALADESLIGAFAGEEGEGTEEDAFAGTGLAGDDGETGFKVEGDGLEEGEVADAESLEHGRGG